MTKLRTRLALIRSLGLGKTIDSFRLRPNFSEIPETVDQITRQGRIAISVHIHFSDQVASISEALAGMHDLGDVFVTCSSPEVFQDIQSELHSRHIMAEVRLSANRGRNFGPLLVEFGPTLSSYETLIHFHTKRTNHAKAGFGSAWASELLAPISMPVLARTMKIFDENPQVGLIYGDVTHRIRAINYYWGFNAQLLNNLLCAGVGDDNLPLIYPAGGMFAVRTSAIDSILGRDWHYEDFPMENNQIDGTVQHAVERYVGHLVTQAGLKHIVYNSSNDAFWVWEGWKLK